MVLLLKRDINLVFYYYEAESQIDNKILDDEESKMGNDKDHKTPNGKGISVF